MLIKNIFSKNSAWVLGFAAAAIFAVTLVGCGEADTKTEYVAQAKVPVNLVTATGVLDALFAENSEVILTKGTNGAEVATLAAGWTVPAGKTLNLNGYGLSLGGNNLILLGSLSGFKNPDGGGKQITAAGVGVVVGKKSAIDAIKDYVTDDKALAGYSSDNTGTISDTTAQTYYFGDFTTTYTGEVAAFSPVLPNTVANIIGSLTINSDKDAIAVPTSVASVSGGITLNGTHNTAVSVFTVAPTSLIHTDGNLVTQNKAQLKIASGKSVSVGGTYTIATGISITNGNIAASADTNVTAAYSAESKKFVLAGLALTNAAILDTVIVTDNATTATAYTVTNAAITGSITGTSTTLTVGATGTIAVGAGGDVTIAAAGILDLSAAGSKVTLADATAKVVLLPKSGSAADAGGAQLAFGTTSTDATAKSGATAAQLTAPAVNVADSGVTTFQFAGAASTHITVVNTTAAAISTILVAGTSSASTDGTITLTGMTGKVATVSTASLFKTTT